MDTFSLKLFWRKILDDAPSNLDSESLLSSILSESLIFSVDVSDKY